MKHNYLILVALFLFSFTHAQIVNIPDANFKNALINYGVDTNIDGEIQVSEAESVTGYLDVSSNNIDDLTGIEAFVNMEYLDCGNNNLSSLDISSNSLLLEVYCDNNLLTSINYSNNTNLGWLSIDDNQLNTLDLSSLPNLYIFSAMNNNLTSLIIGYKPYFDSFAISGNQLTSIDFSMIGINNIDSISITDNFLTEIIFDTNSFLSFGGGLYLDNNQFYELDLSHVLGVYDFHCANNINLEYINMKNGGGIGSGSFEIQNNPNLTFICVASSGISSIEQKLVENGYSLNDVVVNSYCSFVPGGEFYAIEGENKFDADTNGCDINDIIFPNLKFNITDGTINGDIISNSSGAYFIPVQAGIHTITPVFENPDYFTVSPTSVVVDFPTDTSPFNQDFCITPNGTHNDLEIVIIPLEAARPGFDTDYKLLYKNKGNTMLSGNVNLMFQDEVMDFVSANPSVDNQVVNGLTWNYTDLLPFETREIVISMNLNAPTDTPPLNGEDTLVFEATINPVSGDETEADNTHTLNQTVVNSVDPNDKTCLQGETITPEQVGKYVHYMIRFENTGTASAVNIVVKDEIDMSKYDVSTLIPLDASHDFITRIKDDNIVEFIFEDIYLPFDDANNDGYVVFKIKTLDTLELGDDFSNQAEIYFDYNAAIITNDELTTVAENLSVEESALQTIVKIYPNPVSDYLFIESKNTIKSITIYDVNGRLLQKLALTGSDTNTEIDISTLSKGLYFVSIKTDVGVQTTKIIKE